MKHLIVALYIMVVSLWLLPSFVHCESCDCGVFYIIPARSLTEYSSPCSQLSYHNSSFKCSVTTLNSLLNSYVDNTIESRVIFLPGTHVVNSTSRRNKKFPVSHSVKIIGIRNVTIICMIPKVDFTFTQIKYLKISNIHFKNCNSYSAINVINSIVSTLAFELSQPFFGEVLLERIRITSNKTRGIYLRLDNAERNRYHDKPSFCLRDSIISTRSSGIYILDHFQAWKNDRKFIMSVNNVTFHYSCLMFRRKGPKTTNTAYTIANVTFVESACHGQSTLWFKGKMMITFDSVTVTESQSEYVLMSLQASYLIRRNFHFLNNTGMIVIREGFLYAFNAHLRLAGKLLRSQQNSTLFAYNSTFRFKNSSFVIESNRGQVCGGIVAIEMNFYFWLNSHFTFKNNHGQLCGGISATNTNFTFWYNAIVTFMNNYGQLCGGLIANNTKLMLYDNSTLRFISNEGDIGALSLQSYSSLEFSGDLKFRKNYCYFRSNRGPAIVSSRSTIIFNKTRVSFINNTITRKEPLGIVTSENHSFLYFVNGATNFINNSGWQCGGIIATNSNITFNNYRAHFIQNYGRLGGAISLNSLSVLDLISPVHLMFSSNRALKGGAIFIDDVGYIHEQQFLKSAFQISGSSTYLDFNANTAKVGGNNIYGGWIDWSSDMNYNPQISNHLFFTRNDSDSMGIASNPVRICMCENKIPMCNITSWSVTLYPGQSIAIEAVAVGQRFVPTLSHITAELVKGNGSNNPHTARIGELQAIQTVQRTCTRVEYNIESLTEEETLLITVLSSTGFGLDYDNVIEPLFRSDSLQQYPIKLGLLFKQLTITRRLKACPLSFQLNETGYSCICPPWLKLYGLQCDTEHYKILRSGKQWIGVVFDNNMSNPQLAAHLNCPYDYCLTNVTKLSLTLEQSDELCAFNRTGILCGGCTATFSRGLGSSKCKKCSNLWILAVIPGSLVAGVLLIVVLTVLNLTVSVGSINGLIFFANIVRAQHAIFFSPEASNSFLSKFIALLNLDQGFEACLYNGLDSYVEAWLQFCFPVYIWLLMIVIIISSYYSIRVSKICHHNALQVLATLFLLSYVKVFRLVIDVASFTTITYADGYEKTVWLYDGNVEYLKGKHIPLFFAALLLLVLISVPYTISLVSIQWLFKLSHYRVFQWVQGMKPFFDAYTGPYKSNHRYWTGLLLLVRIALLIIFSLNRSNTPGINVFSIALVCFGLLTWLYFTRWVYEGVLNNCLEAFFLLNLGVTSMAIMFQIPQSNGEHSVSTTTYISTGMTFAVFVVIMLKWNSSGQNSEGS